MDFTKQNSTFPGHFIVFWLAFVSFVLTVIFGSITAHAGYAAKRQQVGQAVVISLGPWSHGPTYNYTFKVGRETFDGNASERSHGTHEIGQVVQVYYDPLNPVKNDLSPLTGGWRGAAYVGLMGTGVATALFIFGVILRRRARSLREKSEP
jgi:hypothetical protein